MMWHVDLAKQYKIYCNILKLFKARGYIVPLEGQDLLSEEQYKERYEKGKQDIEIFKHGQSNKSTALFMNVARHYRFLNDKDIESLVKSYYGKCSGMIIITKTLKKFGYVQVEARNQQLIRLANKSKFRVELFNQATMLFSLLEHQLVPKHELLSQTDKEKLLEKYKIKETQLPKILLKDPVARYLGIQEGQIVKITRKSEASGVCITYRIGAEY